jgi:hypothetical protein
MSGIFGNLFGRQYETVESITNLKLEEILNIPPDQISTTKITNDPNFNRLSELKQDAVKYIATRKRLKDKVPYDNIQVDFETKITSDAKISEEVRDMVNEARIENLTDNTARIKDLNDYTKAMKFGAQLPSPPTGSTLRRKEGGKKRSRKQRKQRRRKTRRSV